VDLDQIIAEPSQSKPGLSQERPKELSELEIKQMAKQAKLEPKEDVLSEKQKLFIGRLPEWLRRVGIVNLGNIFSTMDIYCCFMITIFQSPS
jgi:hypothetical protein